MKDHSRSIFHFVLLFIFIFSQVTVPSVSAAAINYPDTEVALQGEQSVASQPSKAMPSLAPADTGSMVVPAESFKSTDSALQIAADLQLLGYTLPSYPYGVYDEQNGLSIEPLVAYNLIVDSNVLAPSSYGPSAATFGAKFCNTSTTDTLTNISAYIGNYDSDYDGSAGGGELGDAVPGSFPRRRGTAPAYDPTAFASAYGASTTNPLAGSTLTDYGATNAPFALQLASGTTPPEVDASRYIGSLAPGECKTEYWMVTYPRMACSSGTVCDVNNASRKDVTGDVKPEDDLWLPYFFWGTSTSGAGTATSYRWNAVSMRNEISAAANKIWPNGDNKVPDEYVAAIAELVGWDTLTPSGTSDVYPGDTVISQGIWYDLGNVGAGFDNNGDFVPDRNAWLQPIGDASGYDPGCFRLVRTYGLVIVKLNDGTEQLIPFVDQMYFENIPENNNGAVGLVYYQYAALDGICTASLTPYQEVASGYDNEKFNADYGAGIPPLQSQESNMTLEKTGDGSVARTGTISYSLTFTLPDINGDPANTTSVIIGQPSYGAPLTYSDAVPVGLQYVANSASTTVDMSSNYTPGDIGADLWHSRDAGATWIMGDPGNYTSTSAGNQLVLQWRLQDGVESPGSGAAYTGTVHFQAVVPGGYSPVEVKNEACLKIGQGPGFECDDHTTLIKGSNWLSGLTWRDDGISNGVLANALRDGTEAVIARVTVNLYYDTNSDGVGDVAFGSVETLPYPVINGYLDFDRDGVTAGDTGDTGTVAGVSVVNGLLDLNGGGVASTDDGTFLGYSVIDGFINIDGDTTVSGDTGDVLAQGSYRFSALPDGSYVVTVDQYDSDIPTGYTTTTRTTRTASLSSTTPSVTGLDFGFGPTLSIEKFIAPTSYLVGDSMVYTIRVTNMLPGDGTGSSSCVYNVWPSGVINDTSDTPQGSSNANGRWHNTGWNFGSGAEPNYITGKPDGLRARTDMANNSNIAGLTGYNLGQQTGTIGTAAGSVQLVLYAYEYEDTQSDDALQVQMYYNNGALGGMYSWSGTYFSDPVGTLYVIKQDITSLRSWAWSDFTGNMTELQLTGNKGGNKLGNFEVDAIGLLIKTNGTCGGASQTLNPVPLTDTFDDTYLDFVSAVPPVSSSGTGSLTWNNVGPLYPGQSRDITVYMRAQTVTTPNTTNTATSTNSRFADGRLANSPVSDTATVTVTANSNTRSLTGVVFDDNNINGWQTALWTKTNSVTGYDNVLPNADTFIQYIPVDLYGCVSASTGALITDEGSNKTCVEQGGTWRFLRSTSTASDGSYTFSNLAQGYYRVHVQSSLIVGPQTADVNVSGPCSTGCDSWSNAENDYLSAVTFVGELDTNTTETRVNFGYNVPSGSYNIGDLVFYDWDGDGVQDAEDEPIPNVTMRLLAADGTYLTSTNTSGVYGFTARPPAYYTVEVVTNTLPSGLVQTKDPDSMMDNKSSFSLTANKLDVDFGYRPYGSGTIGDTVFKDVNGNGTQDGTGESGLTGVMVQLQVDWDGNGTYVTIKTATTDANGKYLFTGLPQGTYRVSINLSSNAAAIPDDSFGNNYFPSNGTNTGTVVYMDKTLATSTSSDLTADFGFAPPAAIGDTVYQDINRNGTQDLNEPGINGVTVGLYTFTDAGDKDGVHDAGEGYIDSNNNGGYDAGEPFTDVPNGRYDPGETLSGMPVQTTATASIIINGREVLGFYQFDGLVPGYYVVQVTPPAGSVLTGDPNVDGFSCDNLNNLADPGEPSLKLCDQREGMRLYNGTNYTGADFGYALAGSFGDRVWIDADGDRLVDAGEHGIPNVTVTATTTVPVGATVVVNGTTYNAGQTINLSTTTDSDGYYFFQNISPSTSITWTVSIGTVPIGLVNTVDPDDPDGDGAPAHNGSTMVAMNSSGMVTAVGALLDADDDDDASDPLYLDADFGYRYNGNGALSGTICLEATDNGICGTGTGTSNVTSGVGSGEAAYDAVSIYLYRWVDIDSDGIIDSGETTQVAVTQTNSSGDYSFANLPDGVYYIVAIGAPQTGLTLDTDEADLPYVGDDAHEAVVPTTNPDGTVLSVYQVVEVSTSETVVNVDFAFSLDSSFDFGDLPNSYATTLQGTPDGPRHERPSSGSFTLYLGSSPDIEANGSPSATASGDGADEDGVSVPTGGLNTSWADGDGGTLAFNIHGSGWLVGWFDLNRDGDFADANEMVVNRSVSTGTLNVNVTSLSNLADGTYYARFRLFATQPVIPALAYSGATTNGEVEDYRFDINGGTPTPVTLSYFYSERKGSTVNFTWSTASETGNVGFNLYVQGKDGLVQLNDELIPSNTVDSLDRQDYTFSIDVAGSQFYIEDVGVRGETELHGPFQLGSSYGSLQETDQIDQSAVLAEHMQKITRRESAMKRNLKVPAQALKAPSWISFQSKLQLNTTLHLKVRQTGIYRVTYEMLKAAGLDLKGVPITKITITNRGKQIPVYAQGKSKFGPGGFIEFYGEALDTIYTDTNIYTLQISTARASRIKEVNARPGQKTTPLTSYAYTLTLNNQRAYANYAPGQDAWYDTQMLVYTTPKIWKIPFQVNGLADSSASATLDLVVWGVTDWPQSPDHHLIVSINGTPVADQTFNGLVEKNIVVSLPAGVLQEGANSLELKLPGDTGVKYDMINLDKFNLTYRRSLQAVDGQLTFEAEGKVIEVTNLPSENVVVYRMGEKGNLVRLKKIQIKASGSTYTAAFAGKKNKVSKYLVTTTDVMYSPTVEATRLDANLNKPAQYLIISHPDFINGLQPLVEARQAQGLSVSVVDVTDVYEQYADGIFDPQAIKDYIAFAAGKLGTEYVLLVGGDTYDYRNYLGRNSISFIPSLYITTGDVAKFVPVDPLYADVNHDKVPELAIGRFPVRTTAELELMINKTLAYANKDYGRTALFISDKYDGIVSYSYINTNLIADIPTDWSVKSVSLDDLSVAAARSQILSRMNEGVALVTFTGHSSATVWTFSDLFNIKNAKALTNHGRPFVVVQWGCWNTYYVDPVNNYLVQGFLFSGDQGAAAVLGASTLTDSKSEELLGDLLTPRMVTPGTPIGLALRDAKSELAQTHPELLDVLLGWSLMGDPALRVTP